MDLVKKLEELHACKSGIAWVQSQEDKSLDGLFQAAMKEKEYYFITWTLVRLLNEENRIRFGIFIVRQVFHICVKNHPNEKRPKEIIKAAIRYIRYRNQEDKEKCVNIADSIHGVPNFAVLAVIYFGYSLGNPDRIETSIACVINTIDISSSKEEMYKKIYFYGFNLLKKQEGVNGK